MGFVTDSRFARLGKTYQKCASRDGG